MNYHIKQIVIFSIALYFLLPIRCKRYLIDIYEQVPPNSILSKGILRKCIQVFKSGQDVILIYDASRPDWEYYDPHLLIFDENRILKGAGYFASQKIDSIHKNVVFAKMNETRHLRQDNYVNDLPKDYQIHLNPDYNRSNLRCGNKIIDGVDFDTSDGSVRFKVWASMDKFILVSKTVKNIDSTLLQKFVAQDTLKYRVSELLFNTKSGVITIQSIKKEGGVVSEFLLVKDEKIMERFLDGLWMIINAK